MGKKVVFKRATIESSLKIQQILMFIGDELAELPWIKARCILLESLVCKLKPLHNIQFWKSSTHSTVWIIITQNVWLFCSTKS